MPLSLAVCRIAVCLSLLLSRLFREDYAHFLSSNSHAAYQPIGLLWFFGGQPPAFWAVEMLRYGGLVFTLLALAGIYPRLTLALSFVLSWALACVNHSFQGGWSHEYNIILLVQLAVIFAPHSDRLTVRTFRREATTVRSPLAYSLPIWLAQTSIAWMFLNAVLHKMVKGGPQVAWIFSDNLRHVLSYQHVALGHPPSAMVSTIMEHPVLYQAFALGNFLCQSAPMLGSIFFRRPWVRAVSGLCFALEVIGLSIFMGRWDDLPLNPHWLVLTAVFIDWDRMSDWWNARASVALATPRLAFSPFAAFALFFVAVQLSVGLLLIDKNQVFMYPFTVYDMYSRVEAKPPVSRHQSYEFFGSEFESPGVDLRNGAPLAYAVLRDNFYIAHPAVERSVLRDGLLRAQADLKQVLHRSEKPILLVKQVLFTVPAYPEKPVPRIAFATVKAYADGAGNFHAPEVLWKQNGDRLVLSFPTEAQPSRLVLSTRSMQYASLSTFGFAHSRNVQSYGVEVPLPGTWHGNSFETENLATGSYLVLIHYRSGEIADAFAGPVVHVNAAGSVLGSALRK